MQHVCTYKMRGKKFMREKLCLGLGAMCEKSDVSFMDENKILIIAGPLLA